MAACQPTADPALWPADGHGRPRGQQPAAIELAGRLDIDSVKQLDRRLFLPRRADIDLDLSKLDFIDEAGLGFLLMVAQKKGGKAEAIACSPVAQRALELGGLSNLMQRPSSQPG